VFGHTIYAWKILDVLTDGLFSHSVGCKLSVYQEVRRPGSGGNGIQGNQKLEQLASFFPTIPVDVRAATLKRRKDNVEAAANDLFAYMSAHEEAAAEEELADYTEAEVRTIIIASAEKMTRMQP
jgi:hypothetical protein